MGNRAAKAAIIRDERREVPLCHRARQAPAENRKLQTERNLYARADSRNKGLLIVPLDSLRRRGSPKVDSPINALAGIYAPPSPSRRIKQRAEEASRTWVPSTTTSGHRVRANDPRERTIPRYPRHGILIMPRQSPASRQT